jgi:hypothetical protein
MVVQMDLILIELSRTVFSYQIDWLGKQSELNFGSLIGRP